MRPRAKESETYHVNSFAEPVGNDQTLATKAASLARTAIINWLDINSEQIVDVFQSKPTVYLLLGGSLVEGLMTRGSDLDFCMMMDGERQTKSAGRLEPSFKRSMLSLDKQLRQLGLSGVCRMGCEIHDADKFLELHRCRESNAAKMWTGAKLNYILSCRLLDIDPYRREFGVRLATEPALLGLKERLRQSYYETLGYPNFPVLPHLLKRPGSYTPRRVLEQIQLAVNNVLLVQGGIGNISGTLDAKISKVVDCMERRCASAVRADMKDRMSEAIDLFRNLKRWAATEGNFHQKSFHQLMSKGYIEESQFKCIRQLTGYSLELVSSLPDAISSQISCISDFHGNRR